MAQFILAQIAIPTAGDCLRVLGPIGGLFFLNWLFHNSDAIIHRLFPHLEWERELGWLNIRAERRAATFIRLAGYVFYGLLCAALYGIVWSATVLRDLPQWRDPDALRELTGALSVLVICGWVWMVYLAGHLIPKLKREYEEEELARFRAELAELERRREEQSPAGIRQHSTFGTKSPGVRRPRPSR
jgi:hypothetical protein